MTQDTRIASEAREEPPRVHHPSVSATGKRTTTHLRREKIEMQNIAAMGGKDTVLIKEMKEEGGSHIKRGRGDHTALLTGDAHLCSNKLLVVFKFNASSRASKMLILSLPKGIIYDPNNVKLAEQHFVSKSTAQAFSSISLQNKVMFIVEHMPKCQRSFKAVIKNLTNFDYVAYLFTLFNLHF